MNTQPTIHYLATRPDGTIPPTTGSAAEYAGWTGDPIPTVNVAAHVGGIVDHPTPGRPWYDESPFSYFRTYTRPGELLERVEWPARLWVVEPLGQTGTWGGYSYWVLCHRLRVIEEAEPRHAFGHRGAKVLATFAELPTLARQWAGEWTADPERTRRTYDAWTERITETHALDWWAPCRAQYSRREAGLKTADQLAVTSIEQAVADAAPEAADAIRLRARCLIAGTLMYDRIRTGDYEKSVRALLLGTALDHLQPVAA
ncbi:hypothetical protein AB0J01_27730 [Streptomyces sp. NPDC050204]|uniref:hypothetical protein n=1 Tax=Streptomyces sp. NPDC050204 TaxID=3155514 RepID=UPI00341C86C4